MRSTFIFFFIAVTSILSAQNQLDYYFDDGGYSKIKNELSWEFSQLLELNIALRYERYFNDIMSVNMGAALRRGNSPFTEFAIFSTIKNNTISNSLKSYSYSSNFEAIDGYELWGGFTFYPKSFNRSSYVLLSTGYNFMINIEEEMQRGVFIGFSTGKKIFISKSFVFGVEFKTRAYSYVFRNENLLDFAIGLGANIGYRF